MDAWTSEELGKITAASMRWRAGAVEDSVEPDETVRGGGGSSSREVRLRRGY